MLLINDACRFVETSKLESDENPDLIQQLQRMYMGHIAERIFAYLNNEDLQNAAAVSPAWTRIIADGNLWQKLYERNVATVTDWAMLGPIVQRSPQWCIITQDKGFNKESYYQEICDRTSQWLKKLRKKWTQGYCTEGYWKSNEYSDRYLRSPSFEFDTRVIVKAHADGRISIRDRWTRCLQHVLEFELDGYEEDYRHNEFREAECIQFNDDMIAAGFVLGHVCIWSRTTKKLLHVLHDYSLAAGLVPDDQGLSAQFIRISDDGSLLLTCLISCDEAYNFLTVRSVKNLDDVSLSAQVLLEVGRVINDVVIDSSCVLVGSNYEDGETGFYEVQVRCSSSLSLQRCIRQPLQSHGRCAHMHYHDGIAVTAIERQLSMWDVGTGNCLRSVRVHDQIVCFRSIRIVSNKYIISCHSNGEVNVWNLESALEDLELDSAQLLWHTYQLNVSSEDGNCCMLMRADEFQIAVEVQAGVYIRNDTLDCVRKATFVLDFVNEETDSEGDE